ncbi:Threonine/homoserine efflux transporter RhtA [Cognatiyoonia koreensis]|uniref:Threonine/homoserine efflux transporter RhtA n=1 Tax=Cognatiyoonia koreensis TaxID=364200 RepID=A0A1I0Q670_9RHOB|nr:DMT family transporter [Cognatiyoonia koreensis]SEW22326.1 Threonine/homoserine efflux transporter RhtA [Cognatiyoonia koreensis]
MQTDRPFLGILLMLGFCVLAPLGDSIGKLLGAVIGLGVLVFVRFSIQAMILLPIVLWRGDGLRLPPGTLWLVLTRTALHICGIAMMFMGLRYLPLADALAIAFVMPFIMLLLGHFVLHEEVGFHRLAACAVGFGGTLLVIQPNFAAVGAPALYPLGVAVVFALFMLVTRQVAKKLDPIKLQTISGLQATAMLLPFFLLLPQHPEFAVAMPDRWTVFLLIALGLLGTFAHLMMTWSLRFAPSATLAPMQYLEIPIGTLIGWMVFKDLPNGLAALGICITVGAGLYIILREQRLSRRQAAPAAE